MLKTTGWFEKLALKTLRAGNNEIVGGGGGRADEMVVDSSNSKNEKSRKLMHMPNIRAIGKPNFLTLNAKKAFNYLWLAFIKALILRPFGLKSYIQIQIDVSSYAIDGVLSQLNVDSNAPLNDLKKSDFGQ